MSRMCLEWEFSEIGKVLVSPDCERAQMTEISRSKSIHRSTTLRLPLKRFSASSRSASLETFIWPLPS